MLVPSKAKLHCNAIQTNTITQQMPLRANRRMNKQLIRCLVHKALLAELTESTSTSPPPVLVSVTVYWVLLSRQRLKTVRKEAVPASVEESRLTPYTSLLRAEGPSVGVQFSRVGTAA